MAKTNYYFEKNSILVTKLNFVFILNDKATRSDLMPNQINHLSDLWSKNLKDHGAEVIFLLFICFGALPAFLANLLLSP